MRQHQCLGKSSAEQSYVIFKYSSDATDTIHEISEITVGLNIFHFEMGINWTPWFDVPLHRRLEVLCIGIFTFTGIFGALISFSILFFFVVISK